MKEATKTDPPSKIYEVTYTSHFACFTCRRASKQSVTYRYERRPWEQVSPEHCCNECGEVMRNMGRYFTSPRRQDVRAWEAAREQLVAGRDTWDRRQYPGLKLLERLPRRRPGAKASL